MLYLRYQIMQKISGRLEIDETTVLRWMKSRQLRAIDIGNGWRIADSDPDRFLKARETAPREKGGMEACARAHKD
jgi:excisionase family DNA binding protein